MNIKEAKKQISNAMKAYFAKDSLGEYLIPIEKQRPVFLMGPPGVGKTAIMEQIAAELGVALVSYSMTHHTRQSALGLPFIVRKTYGGEEYDISEYTMSEIIASVYDMIEKTGKKEGILFLDEINCVSETLSPIMLQFLQYKVFGRHTVPEGWIVVTAGNPVEYNDSAREFDMVTWDRLKRIDITPDFETWREYAILSGVHPAVITYLSSKRDDFYHVETTVDGKSFVTARGWTDLATMISIYEKMDIPVDGKLVSQYIQMPKIAKNFETYYQIYIKYKSAYNVESILENKNFENVLCKLQNANLDEHFALLGIIFDALRQHSKEVFIENKKITKRFDKARRILTGSSPAEYISGIDETIATLEKENAIAKKASSMSKDDMQVNKACIVFFENTKKSIIKEDVRPEKMKEFLVKILKDTMEDLDTMGRAAVKKMNNAFSFIEKGIEMGVLDMHTDMLSFVNDLTLSIYVAWVISRYRCDKYTKYSTSLHITERHGEIVKNIEVLNIDDSVFNS